MKIRELLKPHRRPLTPLQKLLDKADFQDAWTRELRAVLPDELASACRVIDMRGDTLVVRCSDGAVATRLRFEAEGIVAQLRVLSHYSHLQRLAVRVSRGGDWEPA